MRRISIVLSLIFLLFTLACAAPKPVAEQPSPGSQPEKAPPGKAAEPSGTPTPQPQASPEGTYQDPVTGMEFVLVKGGCFRMGDTFGDGSADEQPVHRVCVKDFYLGKYEVTQGQWKEVMGSNPSRFQEGDNYPVESVNWIDAQNFIAKLKQRTGKDFCLATEAEWEYAARSGGKKEQWAGTSSESELEQYAWYLSNSVEGPIPWGRRSPMNWVCTI